MLIIGSGLSFHNLGALGEQWSAAPGARACHPREEHLLPLMVAAGAAAGDAGRQAFSVGRDNHRNTTAILIDAVHSIRAV